MSQLAIVSTTPALAQPSPALGSMTHDLRNLLATVGLHLETLQRLSGPSGTKAADAAHALLTRGATLCNAALDRTTSADGRARRKGLDLLQVARQVADLLAPVAPKEFSFDIEHGGAVSVLGDPDDVFRILFNLMSNAVAVASAKPGSLNFVRVRVASGQSLVSMQIADDGPGLPAGARQGLFARRVPPTALPRHGYGLVIARELAERNGGELHACPLGQGHDIRIEAAGVSLGADAGRAMAPGPSGDGLVM